MRRDMHLAVAVTIACLSASRLAAQDNPLLGVWEHTDTQTTQMITFAPDGTWENRFAWAPSPTTGTGSGRGIARGEYQLTGPTSYSARAVTMEVCPYIPTPAEMAEVARRAALGEGTNLPPCGPASQLVKDSLWPNFGGLEGFEFKMIPPMSMSLSKEGQPAVLYRKIR